MGWGCAASESGSAPKGGLFFYMDEIANIETQNMRVLIADDHVMIRDGLKYSLETLGKFTHIDDADNGQKAIELLRKHTYSLFLLDIMMEGMNGIEVLTQMSNHQIQVPTLVVSFHHPKLFALQAIHAGAMGYICKGAPKEELWLAIGKVLNGQKYLPQEFMEELAFQGGSNKNQLPHERLSNRERQVMIYLAKGLTLGEIATQFCLSEKTISTYRSRILHKMMLCNNVQLASYAIMHKLI